MSYIKTAIVKFSDIPVHETPKTNNYILGFDTDGKLKKMDSNRVVTEIGAATPPAGINHQLQFNNNGVFGASPNLTYDGTDLYVGVDLHVEGSSLFRDFVVFDEETHWYDTIFDNIAATQGVSKMNDDLFTGIKQGDLYLDMPNSVNGGGGYYGGSPVSQSYWISFNEAPALQMNTDMTKIYGTLVLSDSSYNEEGGLRFSEDTLQLYKSTGWYNLDPLYSDIKTISNSGFLSYNLTTTDSTVLVDPTGGAIEVYLPKATLSEGRKYTVKALNVTNAVTVYVVENVGTIDGNPSASFIALETKTFQSDGTNWWII